MPTRPVSPRPRQRPSQEGPPRPRLRLHLPFVLLAVVCVVVTPVGAAASAPSTHAITRETPSSLSPEPSLSVASGASVAASAAQQTKPTPVENDSAVRHRDPDEVEGDSQLRELQGLLERRLEQRLAESSARIDRGQYEQARDLLGETYLERLEQYGEVARERGDENATAVIETYNETRISQREYSRTAGEFRDTYDEYQRAVARGDEGRARELARELARLADETARQSERLDRNYTALGERTSADLTTAQAGVGTVQTDINETSARVTAAEFVATDLRIRRADERGSFTDPLTIEGTLDSEDGLLRNQPVRLRVGAQTAVTRTDAGGDFAVDYRPTAVPANASTVTVRYVPTDRSVYSASTATVPVSLTVTRATVTLDRSTGEAAFGDPVTVVGRVQVDDTPVRNASLAVVAGDARLGTVRTGPSGAFTFTRPLPASVAAGRRQLSVTAAGDGRAVRVPTTTAAFVVPETPTALTAETTRSRREFRVTGSLTAAGRPVPAQPVVVSAAGERLGTARTAADGNFSIAVDADAAGRAMTVSFDGDGTNLRSAETAVAASPRTTPAAGTATAAPAADAADGALVAALTTPAGLVGGSLLLGVGGLLLTLLVRRRRDTTRTTALSAATPAADTVGGEATDFDGADDGATPTANPLAAAVAAFDAGATNEAVVAAYGAVRTTLVDDLPTARARTHRQFLHAALAAGADEEALRTLTDVYETARYGAEGVSETAAATAVDAARTLLNPSTDAASDAADTTVDR